MKSVDRYDLSAGYTMQNFLIVSLLLMCTCTQVSAQSTGKETLSHLEGIGVIVDASGDAIKQDAGWTDIDGAIRDSLRRAGITVYSEFERQNTAAMPYLYIRVLTMRGSEAVAGAYAYSIDMSVNQVVRHRGEGLTPAETYRAASSLGIIDANAVQTIRPVVLDQVGTFIDDWRSTHGE
jgi:hypothetical protein